MTKLKCLCCPRARSAGQYLCRLCWGKIPSLVRQRLNLRDDRAFARLRELHAQLQAGKPLADIEVSA